MRIVNDKYGKVVRHFRTIEIEDGPTVDCGGTGEHESYFPGTLITVDKLKLEWIGDAEPLTVEVSGRALYNQNGRNRYSRRYRMDALPEWVKEILQ